MADCICRGQRGGEGGCLGVSPLGCNPSSFWMSRSYRATVPPSSFCPLPAAARRTLLALHGGPICVCLRKGTRTGYFQPELGSDHPEEHGCWGLLLPSRLWAAGSHSAVDWRELCFFISQGRHAQPTPSPAPRASELS